MPFLSPNRPSQSTEEYNEAQAKLQAAYTHADHRDGLTGIETAVESRDQV